VVFETQAANVPAATAPDGAGAVTDLKIYMKRNADPNLVDMAKQILTISATVLVTIIGFYFGNNSATDAARTIKEAMTKDAPGVGGDQKNTAPGVASGDLQKIAGTIAAMSTAVKAKLQGLGDDPLALLREAVAGAGGSGELVGDLTAAGEQTGGANQEGGRIRDRRRSCERGRRLGSPRSRRRHTESNARSCPALLNDANQANHDFEQAFAKFMNARNTILRKTAKG